MNLINVSTTFILVSCCAFLVGKISAQNRFRSRTATTTTEEPLTEIELTLADRELVLQERELNFKTREETLTIREAAFREREERLTTREKNLEAREQNTLRGSCSNNEDTTPPPDYTLVRYDETMMQYLEIGSTKYCAENMRFFADPDNETAGACDCDYHECSRPLLYSDKYKQCFWAWSQGPCEQGEWYTYDEGYSPICEPNPCPASDAIAISNYYFLNAEDGKCYQTGSKGYCTKPRQRLLTAAFEPIPSCRSKSVCYPLTRPATQECVPGSKRHYDGKCFIE